VGHPILSIVIVTYKDLERLTATLSTLAKMPSEIQIVIVCPLSDIDTRNYCKKFVAQDPMQLILVEDSGLGIYQAMNIGISASSGDYLCFWNSGDLLFSRKNLHRLCSHLVRSQEDWVIAQGVFEWSAPQELTESNVWNFIAHAPNSFISHQTVFFNRKLVVGMGGYDTRFRVGGDTKLISQFVIRHPVGFFESPIVSVEKPNFAASNNRLARIETLLIALEILPFGLKFKAVSNILHREFSSFLKRGNLGSAT
jgi:glycosyltransferase involved in cell wall biosynthesis